MAVALRAIKERFPATGAPPVGRKEGETFRREAGAPIGRPARFATLIKCQEDAGGDAAAYRLVIICTKGTSGGSGGDLSARIDRSRFVTAAPPQPISLSR